MTSTDSTTDPRTAYTAGLRQLADLLDSTPDLPLPATDSFDWFLFGSGLTEAEQKAEATRLVRLLPGKQDKWETGSLFRFRGYLGGLRTQVIVDRDAVCERVVTGTREVIREVPDPEALAAVPTKVVTETVEDVRWECRPLLASDTAEAVPA
jgi:hypothetical protein